MWSPRPERIDNVAGMRTAPRDNSAPCTVQVVCRHGALDLMPPLCPNRQERRFNPPFSTRMPRPKSCAASGKWSAASEAHSLCGCIPRDSDWSECASPLSCLCLTAACSLELRWLGWTTKLNLTDSNADFGSITLFSRCALSCVRRDSAAGAIPDAGYTFEQCAITAANFAHFLACAGLKQGHCN